MTNYHKIDHLCIFGLSEAEYWTPPNWSIPFRASHTFKRSYLTFISFLFFVIYEFNIAGIKIYRLKKNDVPI